MEWFLIGYVVLILIVTLLSFLVLSKIKQKRNQMIEDTDALYENMEAFVSKLIIENDELYRELVNYIRMKESKLDERIRLLEENQVTKVVSTSSEEIMPVHQNEEKLIDAVIPDVIEQRNERISQMHKQGFSPKQIAKILQIDHGEVELIVNMLKIKSSYHK